MSVEEQFLDGLRALGGSAGNGRLREALGWDESSYDGVRLALIDACLIKPGRGRGGSVALANGEHAPGESPPQKAATAKRMPREKSAVDFH